MKIETLLLFRMQRVRQLKTSTMSYMKLNCNTERISCNVEEGKSVKRKTRDVSVQTFRSLKKGRVKRINYEIVNTLNHCDTEVEKSQDVANAVVVRAIEVSWNDVFLSSVDGKDEHFEFSSLTKLRDASKRKTQASVHYRRKQPTISFN